MRTLILVLLVITSKILVAQHNHFIYIQGDNQQLFFVKKSGETFSSSSSGFLILPKLQPGTHQFTIGFPKDEYPEYEFKVEISGKDRGFTLKNYQNKGWGLVDMQSMDITMGKRMNVKKETAKQFGAMSDDPFAVILAAVVDDQGIRETSLVQTAAMVSAPVNKPADKPANTQVDTKAAKSKTPAPELKPPATEVATAAAVDKNNTQKTADAQTTQPKDDLVKKDPAANSTTTTQTSIPPVVEEKKQAAPVVIVDPKNNKTTKSNQKYTAQKVQKISELKTWSGYQLVYIDKTSAVPDTIEVTIDDGVVDTAVTSPSPVVKEAKQKLPRTNCKTMAREKDVLNLRKKMLSLGSQAEMVDAVLKEAKSMCFTVEQIQNLSYVFIDDEGRYALFEKTYPWVLDPANFFRLEKLLNTDEYMNRFRNLIQ